MDKRNTAHASLLVALTALMLGDDLAEAAIERIIVDELGTTFKLDWWNDGRANPYEVSFRGGGIFSDYTFQDSGRLKTLQVNDDVSYIFEVSDLDANISTAVRAQLSSSIPFQPGLRVLMSAPGTPSQGEAVGDSDPECRIGYACTDCEETWDTLCNVGLVDVCYWAGLLPGVLTVEAKTSLTTMCNKFGSACMASSSFLACGGQCIDDFTSGPTPAPTPSPSLYNPEACDPNRCENGGSCRLDVGGGHVCSCKSGYGGMSCQTDTSPLAEFYIEIEYVGMWTDERRAVFRSAADRWEEVITHVPCGGSAEHPAGRLLISASLEPIDGVEGALGSAGPTNVWNECRTVSFEGAMQVDIADVAILEDSGTLDGVILHEMGHVIGVGTLWGDGLGGCTTCCTDGNPAWSCPAALSAFYDLGGSAANILAIHQDGETGATCGHLDEAIFYDEVMTGHVNSVMYLSKMTAAVLEDIKYIVDANAVDPYTIPSQRDPRVRDESTPSLALTDIAVGTTLFAMDGNGTIVEEVSGITMKF